MNVCRVCAHELNAERSKQWTAIGKCPICGEKHILYTIISNDVPIGNVAVALLIEYPAVSFNDAVYYAREMMA